MSNWNLTHSNGNVMHNGDKFVARFRSYHRKTGRTPAKFMKALKAQHTPESYFAEMAAGKAPFEIVSF